MASNNFLAFILLLFFLTGCQESQKEIEETPSSNSAEGIEYQLSVKINLTDFLTNDLSVHQNSMPLYLQKIESICLNNPSIELPTAVAEVLKLEPDFEEQLNLQNINLLASGISSRTESEVLNLKAINALSYEVVLRSKWTKEKLLNLLNSTAQLSFLEPLELSSVLELYNSFQEKDTLVSEGIPEMAPELNRNNYTWKCLSDSTFKIIQSCPWPDSVKIIPFSKQDTELWLFMVLTNRSLIKPKQIVEAHLEKNVHGDDVLDFSFNQIGTRKFAKLSQQFHKSQKPLAIVADNQILSAPTFNSPIVNGKAKISGGPDDKGVFATLATVLNSPLPFPIEVVAIKQRN